METERSCKGCIDYNQGCIVIISQRIKCPCQTCLIKGICETACKDFESMYQKTNITP